MKVVVTIPAFNEEKTIVKVIDGIKKAMTKYDYKLIVVDDGSTDKTALVSKNLGAIVYSHQRNMGLAETFKTEMEKALLENPDVIVHFDADGQYLASEIPLLINKIDEGYDLVLGSRFMGKIERMPFLKRIGNILFSKLISNIAKINIVDAQTGFRAFTREIAEKIKISSNYTYTQEQIIRASRERFRLVEVPVHFLARDGKSRLMKNPFHYAARAGVNILRVYRDYEPLKFFGIFGGIFLFVGFILGCYLVSLYLIQGFIGKVPTLVLTMLLILIGAQIMLFGFLADMNRK